MMDSAFAWLGQVVEWLGRFIPRMVIVRSTHAGVRFKHGKDASKIEPGLCFYWPLVTEVEIVPVARQTHNLPSQVMMTKDGRRIVVSGVVVYSIVDVVATMGRNWDVRDTMNDLSMWAITQIVATHDYQFLLENLNGKVQSVLTKLTRRRLNDFGLHVHRAFFTDFSTAFVMKNLGSSGPIPLGSHNME